MLRIRSGVEHHQNGGPHVFIEIEFQNASVTAKYCEGLNSTLEVRTVKGQTMLLNETRSNAAEMRRMFFDYTGMSVDQCKKALYEARVKTAAPFHDKSHNVMTIKGTAKNEAIYYCVECCEVIEYFLDSQ